MSTDAASEDTMTATAPQTDAEKLAGTLSVLPVQDAPRTSKNALKIVRGLPGRPRKVERAATVSDLEYHAKIIAERLKFVDDDDLVKAMGEGQDTLSIFKLIRAEMAKEVASLKHEKVEIEKRGRDTVAVSGKRIDALLKLANLETEIKKLGSDAIDLKSERAHRLFAYLINTMREVATEILPPETVDLLFGKFASATEGWEDKALSEIEK